MTSSLRCWYRKESRLSILGRHVSRTALHGKRSKARPKGYLARLQTLSQIWGLPIDNMTERDIQQLTNGNLCLQACIKIIKTCFATDTAMHCVVRAALHIVDVAGSRAPGCQCQSSGGLRIDRWLLPFSGIWTKMKCRPSGKRCSYTGQLHEQLLGVDPVLGGFTQKRFCLPRRLCKSRFRFVADWVFVSG